jgi:hypothetical protein
MRRTITIAKMHEAIMPVLMCGGSASRTVYYVMDTDRQLYRIHFKITDDRAPELYYATDRKIWMLFDVGGTYNVNLNEYDEIVSVS